MLAVAGCEGPEPEVWGKVEQVAVTGRVRIAGGALLIDHICARPTTGTIQELVLEVSREKDGEAGESLLRLQASTAGPAAAYLCVGPARIPDVRGGPGVRIKATVVAVVDGASYRFHDAFPIE